MTTPTVTSTPTTLKFKNDGSDWRGGYVALLPNGDRYRVFKTQRILLGRFGGGTTHTFWGAEFLPAGADQAVKLLTGSKWAPEDFTSPRSDTKREAVTAATAHANGARNEADKDDRR